MERAKWTFWHTLYGISRKRNTTNNNRKIIKLIKFEKIVIDPVFADNGKIYSIFDNKIISGFRKIIKYANIITPNITELEMLSKSSQLNNKDDIIKAILNLDIKGVVVVTSVKKEIF